MHQLAERFDAAVAEGELSGVDTVLLARWIAAVCQGISIQARSGAGRDDLHAVADLALAGLPACPGWLAPVAAVIARSLTRRERMVLPAQYREARDL